LIFICSLSTRTFVSFVRYALILILPNFMSEKPDIDIDYIAKLERLDLDAGERCSLKTELAGILDHFEKLNTVDVTGVEPMAHAHSVLNVWREGDEAQSTYSAEAVCRLAPRASEGQVVVPKVVE
jgi:aspartyl-tRNA(Asn)/glutamyl-tRNA(Gln) amidotransferase subunit C